MKVIVIGCGGGSVAALIALVELAKEHDYAVLIDSGNASMATIGQRLPEPEVFEFTRNRIEDLPEIFIEPEVVLFSKFRETKHGNKYVGRNRNFSHRRR